MTDTLQLLTDEQMRQFVCEGFVVLQTDFSDEFHRNMLSKLDDVYATDGNPGNNLLPRVPELHKVFDHPAIKGALTSVLGEDYIMHPHRHGHFNNSPQAGGWHKDSYWGYDKIRMHHPWWAMIFYYPQDVTLDMGPTGVMPGTQAHQERNFEQDETVEELKAEGGKGTFVLVQYDIWHRANANSSGKSRYMLKFQFVRTRAPQSPSWDTAAPSVWQAPERLTTTVPSHEVMWRENWNWLSGQIGSLAGEALTPASSEETAQWLAQSRDDDRTVRTAAIDKLALYGDPAQQEAIIAALTGALSDAYEPVALNAAYGLNRWGQDGLAALLQAIVQPELASARAAGYGLSAADATAVQPLVELIGDPHASAQTLSYAAFALGELRELATPAIAALAAHCTHADERVRYTAVEALGSIPDASGSAIDALQHALQDQSAQVRFTAALSLTRLGADAAAAVPALAVALDDDNRYVRANAAEALQAIDTKEARQSLFTFLRNYRWCSTTTVKSTFYP